MITPNCVKSCYSLGKKYDSRKVHDGELIDDFRKTTNKGMAIGNHDFIKEIEDLTGYDRLVKIG